MAGGCIEERTSQVVRGHTLYRPKKRRNNYWTKRADEMVALYQCGFSLQEIAAQMGTYKALICITLQGHPDYRPRVGGRPPNAPREFEVPGWVSDQWHPRYCLIAQRHGEHVAASCIRVAKRLGVSA